MTWGRPMIRGKSAAVLAVLVAGVGSPGAEEEAKRAIPVSSSSPTARAAFERGLAAADNNRDAEAAQELRAALKIDPQFRLAQAWLGKVTPGAPGLELLSKAAEGDEVLPPAERALIDHLVAVRRDDPKALALGRKLVQLAPDDWRSHQLLAEYLDALGDHAESADEARKALALDPGAGAAWSQLGYALIRQGRGREALEVFRRFAELAPQEPNPRDALGESLMLLGRLDQAEAAFRKATQLSSSFYLGWEGAAYCNFYRGLYDIGRADVSRSIEAGLRDDERLDQYRLVAWSFLAAGDGKTALAQLAPLEQSPLRSWQAAQDRGSFLIEMGRTAEGLEALQLAWKRADQAGLSGDQRSVLEREGNAFRLLGEVSAGNLKDAQKTADRLTLLAHGRRGKAWASVLAFARGKLLLARGDSAAALKALSGCIAEDPLCRRELLRVLTLSRSPQADQAREALLREGRRTPLDLYVRAQIARGAPPR
jgi:tetratricopeptide (TPR) repeat protein